MSFSRKIEEATEKARSTGENVEVQLTDEEWEAHKSTTETVYVPSMPSINTGPGSPLRVILVHGQDRIYISV